MSSNTLRCYQGSSDGLLQVSDYETIYLERHEHVKIHDRIKESKFNGYSNKLLVFYMFMILFMNITLSLANETKCTSDNYQERYLNATTIHFVCGDIKNVCDRIYYVRNYLRYHLCDRISLLYLLPNIDSKTISNLERQTNYTCENFQNLFPDDHYFGIYLSTSTDCYHSLSALVSILDDRLKDDSDIFEHSLNMSFCINNSHTEEDSFMHSYPGNFYCNSCRTAYRNWLCSVRLEAFIPNVQQGLDKPTPDGSVASGGGQPNSNPSKPKQLSKMVKDKIFQAIQPCESWCVEVEKLCPYLIPSDETTNGGEPAFLCDESHYYYQSRKKTNELVRRISLETHCCYELADLKPLFNISSTNVKCKEESDPKLIDTRPRVPNCQSMAQKCLPICKKSSPFLSNDQQLLVNSRNTAAATTTTRFLFINRPHKQILLIIFMVYLLDF